MSYAIVIVSVANIRSIYETRFLQVSQGLLNHNQDVFEDSYDWIVNEALTRAVLRIYGTYINISTHSRIDLYKCVYDNLIHSLGYDIEDILGKQLILNNISFDRHSLVKTLIADDMLTIAKR